jgi:hypothetical protein
VSTTVFRFALYEPQSRTSIEQLETAQSVQMPFVNPLASIILWLVHVVPKHATPDTACTSHSAPTDKSVFGTPLSLAPQDAITIIVLKSGELMNLIVNREARSIMLCDCGTTINYYKTSTWQGLQRDAELLGVWDTEEDDFDRHRKCIIRHLHPDIDRADIREADGNRTDMCAGSALEPRALDIECLEDGLEEDERLHGESAAGDVDPAGEL